MSTSGILTVARQELRLRMRAGRWRWLLGAWFVIVAGFTGLERAALDGQDVAHDAYGTVMYGGLMLFVLALALLVVPALTAQSVNGDRERGVLATLQVTRLQPYDIALGKLAAAWGTTLAFLAATVPLIVWCVAEGGVSAWRLVVTTGVVALLLGVVCAVALALSALLARSTTSSVLSYLAVFALTVGTLVVFGLATAATSEKVTQTVQTPGGVQTWTSSQSRPDRTWWLLAPNPFVVLADAAPVVCTPPRAEQGWAAYAPLRPGEAACAHRTDVDPLGAIGRSVRDLRSGPGEPAGSGGLVWPYGLAADLTLGGAAVWLTARRLRTPSARLPRGLRVA